MQPFDRLSIQFHSLRCCKANPLVCPMFQGTMRIISFIEDAQVIREILTHLGLWLIRSRPPPKIHNPPALARLRRFVAHIGRKSNKINTAISKVFTTTPFGMSWKNDLSISVAADRETIIAAFSSITKDQTPASYIGT